MLSAVAGLDAGYHAGGYLLDRRALLRKVLAPRVHLLDILALVGIGGVWVGTYMAQLKKMPLLPLHDPRFEGVLEHEHGD